MTGQKWFARVLAGAVAVGICTTGAIARAQEMLLSEEGVLENGDMVLPSDNSLFFFGHIWHGSRTLFRDVFAGIDPDLSEEQVEWGLFQKVGDKTTRRKEAV